jgi:hypothetical protein
MNSAKQEWRNKTHANDPESDHPSPASILAFRVSSGLTLIEVIGVLAILVILTAAITPVAVRRVDIAARTKEFNDLIAISNGLTLQISRSFSIPGATGTAWATNVAIALNQAVTNITTNPRRFQRLYLVDPNIANLTLPYTQTGNNGLTAAPTNARVMVVSSIARTNVPSSINFNETWNWNNVLNANPKPASWAAFPGSGEDVCIQRINLGQMFYQLVLVNRDQNYPGGATNAPFNINGLTPPTIITNVLFPGGMIWNNYYLGGSAVGLWATNGYGTNVVATTYILNQNASFVFENGTWNGQIQGCPTCTNAPPPPSSPLASQYNAAAINFFNSLWNSAASGKGGKGAAQTAVLSAFGNFMMDYSMWADATSNGVAIPFSSNGDNNSLLPMLDIIQAEQGNVDTYTGTGQGSNSGLLHE